MVTSAALHETDVKGVIEGKDDKEDKAGLTQLDDEGPQWS